MKKPKFKLEIDRNNNCKVYLNKKWQKDVTAVALLGKPQDYTITIEQYKRDANGQFIITSDELERTVKTFYIGEAEK